MAKRRADLLVFEQGLANSREKAKRMIMAGEIYVNEVKVSKPGEMFSEETVFIDRGEHIKYVSRGGYKLEKAIDAFEIDLSGKICADFGASTGGFTDCMLKNEAAFVYSIDVGYGQLDWSLRNNDKVRVIEKTNIRYLDNSIFDKKPDFISIDVSFISLELILPKAFENLNEDGTIVALIKPQFEAKKDEVGKNGIIKDNSIRKRTIKKIYNFVIESGFVPCDLTYSPVKGTKGNVEYLILIRKDGKAFEEEKIEKIVREGNENLK